MSDDDECAECSVEADAATLDFIIALVTQPRAARNLPDPILERLKALRTLLNDIRDELDMEWSLRFANSTQAGESEPEDETDVNN